MSQKKNERVKMCRTFESALKIQKQWLELGLKVQISPLDNKAVFGDYKFAVTGWR